jgi:hypothetical protein
MFELAAASQVAPALASLCELPDQRLLYHARSGCQTGRSIRKGKNLSASFNDGQGSTVKVDISLVGFIAAFLKSEDQ